MLHHCQFWKSSLDFKDKLGSFEKLILCVFVAQISHSKLCVSVYFISVRTRCFSIYIHAWQGLLITPRIYFIEGRNLRKPSNCVEIAWNSAHLKSNVAKRFGGGGWNPVRRIARIGHPSKFQPLSVWLTFKDRAEIGFSLWCKSQVFLVIDFM